MSFLGKLYHKFCVISTIKHLLTTGPFVQQYNHKRIGEMGECKKDFEPKGGKMKKVFVSVFALAALTACAGHYDYYEGGVRYTQDGPDCIYYAGEYGHHFTDSISGLDNNKQIVYRNTRCSELYARDHNEVRADRGLDAPVYHAQPKCAACSVAEPVVYAEPVVVPQPTCGASCGCNHAQTQPISRRKYVIVSGM